MVCRGPIVVSSVYKKTEKQMLENSEVYYEPKKAKVAMVSMGSARRNLATEISGSRIYEVEEMDCDI
jgi:pyruvate/2-oxoacid:ferredoxin oxidoreductase alpha subunit